MAAPGAAAGSGGDSGGGSIASSGGGLPRGGLLLPSLQDVRLEVARAAAARRVAALQAQLYVSLAPQAGADASGWTARAAPPAVVASGAADGDECVEALPVGQLVGATSRWMEEQRALSAWQGRQSGDGSGHGGGHMQSAGGEAPCAGLGEGRSLGPWSAAFETQRAVTFEDNMDRVGTELEIGEEMAAEGSQGVGIVGGNAVAPRAEAPTRTAAAAGVAAVMRVMQHMYSGGGRDGGGSGSPHSVDGAQPWLVSLACREAMLPPHLLHPVPPACGAARRGGRGSSLQRARSQHIQRLLCEDHSAAPLLACAAAMACPVPRPGLPPAQLLSGAAVAASADGHSQTLGSLAARAGSAWHAVSGQVHALGASMPPGTAPSATAEPPRAPCGIGNASGAATAQVLDGGTFDAAHVLLLLPAGTHAVLHAASRLGLRPDVLQRTAQRLNALAVSLGVPLETATAAQTGGSEHCSGDGERHCGDAQHVPNLLDVLEQCPHTLPMHTRHTLPKLLARQVRGPQRRAMFERASIKAAGVKRARQSAALGRAGEQAEGEPEDGQLPDHLPGTQQGLQMHQRSGVLGDAVQDLDQPGNSSSEGSGDGEARLVLSQLSSDASDGTSTSGASAAEDRSSDAAGLVSSEDRVGSLGSGNSEQAGVSDSDVSSEDGTGSSDL
eukprot:118837-Chlamydomonas_euryale.AAC.1